MNTIKIILLLLISTVTLLSCGFHFRGAITVPEVMQEVFISGDVSTNNLGKVLFRRLTQLGVTRLNFKENASSIISITKNSFIRRVLTVDAATKASAYKLDVIVGFEVTDVKGKVLLPNQQIRQTREYNIDPNNALASGDQENRLKLEMTNFIVNQMLTRISIVLKDIK